MLQKTPLRRRIKTFKEWIKPSKAHVAVDRQIRQLAEAMDLTKKGDVADETATLSYFILSIPKDCTYAEKIDRLSEIADTVLAVEKSDVMCFSMWVPSGDSAPNSHVDLCITDRLKSQWVGRGLLLGFLIPPPIVQQHPQPRLGHETFRSVLSTSIVYIPFQSN